MATSLTFGQFVATDSALHRLDTRVKLVLVIAYSFALFLSSSWIGLGLCIALMTGAYMSARIPLKLAFRGLKPIMAILCFTVVFSTFTVSAASNSDQVSDTISLIEGFGISLPGMFAGFFSAIRLVLLFCMASLLTYTSPLITIVDAIASLIRPLKRFGLPVEDISVICAMTLRFVPTMVEETNKIMRSQASRGLSFNEGNLMQRAKAWIPVIIPLFVSLFKRAERLASAMEARCYRSDGRTHLHAVSLKTTDAVIGIVSVISLIALGILF